MIISACYIVKNEAENLIRSLESLKDNIDELIVVDTGSQDSTPVVANKYNAKIFNFPWQDDFSKARNFALEQAYGDWVIFLDADEYFVNSEGLASYIRKANTFPGCEALLIPLFNINTDTGSEQAELISKEYSLRIWRNKKTFRFVGCVHEMLLVHEGDGMRPPKMITAHDKFTLHHTGYSANLMPEKHRRYLSMLQREISEQGEQPLSARYLADCYFGLSDYEKAAYYASRAISREKQMGITTVAGVYKLYRYWLESAVRLGYSDGQIKEIAEKAIYDTRKEKNHLSMCQLVNNLLAKAGG